MRSSFVLRAAAIAAVALPAAARAQNAAIANNPAKLEFGADAGASFGLGHNSTADINLPATQFRVGFFVPGEPRLEIEPNVGFEYAKVTGSAAQTRYQLGLGALYHFRAPTYVTGATGATVAYVRPFINYIGYNSAADTPNSFTIGGGLGVKLPVRANIAIRGEANLGYDTQYKAARLGLLLGGSFFAFR